VHELHLHRSSGMILRPGFYRPPTLPRTEARRALGLDEHTPTGVVLFGGQGSRAMLDIAERLHDVPLILMCGHNQALAAKLKAQAAEAPRVIVGYTTEVATYLRLGDFFIGKPGPGSLSEALHCGLPVIVTRNAWTLPQERYNTDWVREQRVGLVLSSFAGVREAVARLRAQLPQFVAQVRRMDNRALFELPQILAGIHSEARHAQGADRAALAHVLRPMPAANDDLAAGVQAS
jgi:UDP-N-acetylglucosamine:LPS N-acetylglucosamine transferase